MLFGFRDGFWDRIDDRIEEGCKEGSRKMLQVADLIVQRGYG